MAITTKVNNMKIGVFDSGMGGLVILQAILSRIPQYDYVYLGDTANLPYGNHSTDMIYTHTKNAMDFLLKTKDCALVIIACNTASIAALRKLQQEYLPNECPDRRILGVVVPTMEEIAKRNLNRVGLIATLTTVQSGVYAQELAKISDATVISLATPLLVPLIENNGDKYAREIITDYIRNFDNTDIQAIVLGCTHYPVYKKLFAEISGLPIISQDEIIPNSLADYLERHPEIESRIGQNATREFYVSDINPGYKSLAQRITGIDTDCITKVNL